jgi:hypothetical protein
LLTVSFFITAARKYRPPSVCAFRRVNPLGSVKPTSWPSTGAMIVEDVGSSASAADPANPENATSKAETIRVRMSKTFILQRPIEL